MTEMPTVHVTDHAILRWLERVHNVDIEAIRREIAIACDRGAGLGAPCIRTLGARFLLREQTVVTCVGEKNIVGHAVLVDFCRPVEEAEAS